MTRRPILLILAGAAALGVLLYRLFAGGLEARPLGEILDEARNYEREGQTESAIGHYRAALALEPENLDVNREYQNAMRRLGKLAEVRAEYARRLANFPGRASARYLAARLEEGAALEEGMKRALECDGSFIWAHRALGRYYSEAGRFVEAKRHLERVLGLPGASLEDAGTLLHGLYRSGGYADIDGYIWSWNEKPPSFARGQPVLSFALGRVGAEAALQLHVAVDPSVRPYVLEMRLVRDDHRGKNVRVAVTDRGEYWMRARDAWTASDALGDESAARVDLGGRPTFAELLGILMGTSPSHEK